MRLIDLVDECNKQAGWGLSRSEIKRLIKAGAVKIHLPKKEGKR